MVYTGTEYVDDFFAHHGIKGQRWGVRRFQNEDGTLTEAGKKRYDKINRKYTDKNTGKFSTRKSTKLDLGIRTGYAAAATGAAFVGALSNPVGLGVLLGTGAAVSVKSIAGAIKRERARKFLENTGTGNNEEINADRRYATSVDPFFSLIPLGNIVKLSYGTHREKVAENVKKSLETTTIKEAVKENSKIAENKEKEYKNVSELFDAAEENVKNREGKTANDIKINARKGPLSYLNPFSDININKKNAERRRLINEETKEFEKLKNEELEKQKNRTKNPEFKKILNSNYMIPEVKSIERMFKNAKSKEELEELYYSDKVQQAINKAVIASNKKANEIGAAGKGKSNQMLYSLLEDQVTVGADDITEVMIPQWYEKREKELAHSGILGMKWGRRRYQYEDGSLTPEGRKRYLKGGEKQIKKIEKDKARREAILSDRKKLYKHRDEFTKEELDKAMEKFAAQDRLKAQMDEQKTAEKKAKEEAKKAKFEYKKAVLQAKMEKKRLEEQQKQNKLQTEQKQLETEAKEKTSNASTKAELWAKRVAKTKNIWEFAKTGQEILSDMGITSKDGSDSLLGALAESIGIKDSSGKRSAAEAKKEREKKTAELNFEKLIQQVEQEKWKTKQAEYNYNNLNNGKGGGLTKQDIEDILRDNGLIP